MSERTEEIRQHLTSTSESFRQRLLDWVRIPSIAGDEEHRRALLDSAELFAEYCRADGFPRVEVWPQGDSNAVFAEWPTPGGAGAPTVLVYSHHDVRALAGDKWTVGDPFDPFIRDGLLYGRGSSDAKAQALMHLWALSAHLGSHGSAPRVHVKLLIEGEEELGSPHLQSLLDEHRADLGCDFVLFSDTTLVDADYPAVCTSVRGMLGATVTLHGPQRDVHSGAVSGPAPNPILDLAFLLARLHDERGRITLPRFYDRVSTPDAAQRAEYAALPITPSTWLEETRTPRVGGEEGFTIPELLWARPSLEVISIEGGDTEGLPRAVIPATATAELSIRIVDGQRTEEVGQQLREWLEREATGLQWELTLSELTAQQPYRTPQSPQLDALAAAMGAGFESAEVGRMGNAGGGPAELLARMLDAPVLFFGTGLVTDNWHAADERVDLAVVEKGAATLAHFWALIAEQQS
ncbi:M20/M25/M40 family metallo-hydrolase [Ruicaihuangia caeni]|uniref:M20/M25/M40 family metallo-hydrolase n=1 Tax=Ruicaihuangia caeni TaxID=3042517 RepID=UPI003390342D